MSRGRVSSEAAVDVDEADFFFVQIGRRGGMALIHDGNSRSSSFGHSGAESHGGDRAAIGSTGTSSDSAAKGPPSPGHDADGGNQGLRWSAAIRTAGVSYVLAAGSSVASVQRLRASMRSWFGECRLWR
jgi:hypothetical protein